MTPTPPRPLSIVHLCAPAEVGGLERVVQGLAQEGVRQGHRVHVVVVQHPDADLSVFLDEMDRSGVEIHRIRLKGRRYLAEIRAVAGLLVDVKPDVLHCHGYRCDILHGWHSRRRGVTTVSTLHGSSRMGGLSHLFEWFQLRALRRFDAVVAVSRPLEEELLGLGIQRDRLHLIPNAWTPPSKALARPLSREFLGLGGLRGSVIGWVGRLIPIKGCDVFLEALAFIEDLDWTAVIVGDGPERTRLERWVEKAGFADRVRFLGAIPNAARFFSAFDLQVLSSRSEGTPMVLLEAMGAGVPVVATAVGGVPDLLKHREDGWIVPPESSRALGDALRSALSDPEGRALRTRNAKAKSALEYSSERWMERHEQVYLAAMASGDSPIEVERAAP